MPDHRQTSRSIWRGIGADRPSLSRRQTGAAAGSADSAAASSSLRAVAVHVRRVGFGDRRCHAAWPAWAVRTTRWRAAAGRSPSPRARSC